MEKKFKPCAKCRRCFYSGPVNINIDNRKLYSCDYYLITGNRRPCPPGAACTVYNPDRKKNVRPPDYFTKERTD